MFGAFTYSEKGEYVWHFGNKKVFLKLSSPIRAESYMHLGHVYVKMHDETVYFDEMLRRLSIEYNNENFNLENIQKKYTSKQLFFGFMNSIAESFYEVIKQNTHLLRECNTNMYITVDTERAGVAGEYFIEKSDFGNIFICIALQYVNVVSFLLNQRPDKKSESYRTTLHEFAHSYDMILQRIKNPASELELSTIARVLDTNLYSSENVFLCKQIGLIRTEGLAAIVEGTLSQKSELGMIFSLREIFHTFGKDENLPNDLKIINHLVGAIGFGMSLDKLNEESKKYGSRFPYTLGRFFCLIILLSKLSYENKEIYFFGGLNPPKKLLNVIVENGYPDKEIENTEEFRKSGYFQIHRDYLISFFNSMMLYKDFNEAFQNRNFSDFWIFVPKKSISKFEYVLNFISRTNVSEFLFTYLKACEKIKMNPGQLDLINLQKLTTLAKEHRKKLAINLGFNIN